MFQVVLCSAPAYSARTHTHALSLARPRECALSLSNTYTRIHTRTFTSRQHTTEADWAGWGGSLADEQQQESATGTAAATTKMLVEDELDGSGTPHLVW